MDQQESSSSWLLRTHFSRAVCHRPGTCNPSNTWIKVPPPALATQLLAEKVKAKDLQLDFPTLKKLQYRREAPTEENRSEATSECLDFSFPSPFSSSPLSRAAARPSCSASQSCFLRSILNTLSATSNRWSTSSDSFNERQEEHSLKSSSKSSNWFSWISPKASPKSSPRVSPAITPKGSPKGSPRGSFRKTIAAMDSFDKDDSAHSETRFDLLRVPSWSQHLSSAGNERAVLSAEKWMVNLSQLLLGERFATGNHSRIYQGMYNDSDVAVKVIRQPDEDCLLADRLEQIFTNEVTTLSILNHRNIIKFFAACKKPPVLCVITEYVSGGSLRSFLHKREGQLLPIDEVLRMALNIAAGMEYLHMKGIIHRDLKSENLVIAEDGCIKVLDFGVSCFESHCDYKADDPGTYRWMAPEMLCHKPYTKMVDVYSFGIVMWELLTARVPYEDMGAVQAAFCVLHKNLRPSIPSDCPPALEDLMCRCWCKDPNKRPEFWEIMRELALIQHSLDTSSEVHALESPQHYSIMPSWLQTE
ncbi:hypothetical protein GOP47_0011574 [Adiantum capillus-veneris]|uniref:Protein kinase domain-containing protein n=1 Tax=Adiantum capillus-veneris TaxID=13818 RepID=A0A9D4UTJ6_ADICA|nr:hypothetical protein GOP47_0011574 [Adiantum capillus-veneris]